MNPRLLDPGLHHFPVPGKLSEQSKSEGKREVSQRRWRAVVAARLFPFVAQNREAACLPGFFLTFQRFRVGLHHDLVPVRRVIRHARTPFPKTIPPVMLGRLTERV